MVPIERELLEDVIATLGMLVRRGNRITNVARRLRRTIDEVLQLDQERERPRPSVAPERRPWRRSRSRSRHEDREVPAYVDRAELGEERLPEATWAR